jgi:hypothetical protein
LARRWTISAGAISGRIDKSLGIDQPVKLDLRLNDLWAKIDAGLLSLGDNQQ